MQNAETNQMNGYVEFRILLNQALLTQRWLIQVSRIENCIGLSIKPVLCSSSTNDFVTIQNRQGCQLGIEVLD